MTLRPYLRDVTLVAVTSVAVPQTLRALDQCLRQLRFGRTLFLSDQSPPGETDPAIEWRRVDPLGSRAEYSRFMLHSLADHIETSHALCIQWDGYVLDGRRWDPAFLDYDYIGAPWPHFSDDHRVGNGGFSLRSARLLRACKRLPLDADHAEDVVVGRLCRPLLEQQGIRFAPESVARRFAYERMKPTGREFGFHGAFNLVRYLPPSEAGRLFRDLEPAVLARSERWELLRWALGHGRLSLACTLAGRLV